MLTEFQILNGLKMTFSSLCSAQMIEHLLLLSVASIFDGFSVEKLSLWKDRYLNTHTTMI